MKVAVIGAGITGLTAAHRLSQRGHRVIVFEKENYVGGLASGFKAKNWGWTLERFFHHLFVSDWASRKLITELDLSPRLFYRRPKTSILFDGKISQFDSPFSILAVPYFSFSQKLRIGLVTAYLKATNNWEKFEKITATSWLPKFYGEKPYQILWEPLLKSKFGPKAKQVSMAWFWARIKKRSPKLGYIKGGFQTLIDKLREKIVENGGQVWLDSEIKRYHDLNHDNKFDRIILTTPVSVFLKITKDASDGGRLFNSELQVSNRAALAVSDSQEKRRLCRPPPRWRKETTGLKMHGALNLILILKEKFLTDGTYWLNINEPGFPFAAVVEHTNFIDAKHYGNNHILYVGGYYPQNHPYFKMTKKQIFKKFLPYLKKINPKFDQLSIINYQLSINSYAQPIIPVNYSKLIPPFKTPIPNVYLANMQMIYPWDRGINYAIELGEKVASKVSQSTSEVEEKQK